MGSFAARDHQSHRGPGHPRAAGRCCPGSGPASRGRRACDAGRHLPGIPHRAGGLRLVGAGIVVPTGRSRSGGAVRSREGGRHLRALPIRLRSAEESLKPIEIGQSVITRLLTHRQDGTVDPRKGQCLKPVDQPGRGRRGAYLPGDRVGRSLKQAGAGTLVGKLRPCSR